jgi:thermostable 8-oxoguanine DNA glycosylase
LHKEIRDVQSVWAGYGDGARLIALPDSDEEVVCGVRWGAADNVGTPAYWAVRCRWNLESTASFACGASSLIEEVGFCLLGGYSVTYEANLAAFKWLRGHGVFDLSANVPESQILALLSHPLEVQGRPRRYRFPNQRAMRIAAMRQRIAESPPDSTSPRALRDHLMLFKGIGPKTASWIVRNHLDSDEVAIIDVHVLRACRRMNLFPENILLPRDYGALEERFLNFAKAINVRSSMLDAVMWTETRAGGLR